MNSSDRPPRILVVDDEEPIRRALYTILARRYDVVLARDGEEAIELAIEKAPDVVILDLSMPGMEGIEVCRRLRTCLATPIVVLSVRGDDEDKIAALDSGADDYMTKPFSAGELLARIRAHLRRPWTLPSSEPTVEVGDLVIDISKRLVSRNGEEVKLTRTEFDILACLLQNANRAVTAQMILQAVWGPDSLDEIRTLRVHVTHLRQKIERQPSVPRYILTEPGVGYRFRIS